MIVRDASFEDNRRLRWWLSRTWSEALGHVLFVGLNPSKADEKIDDMTVKKGMGFAARWKHGGTFHANAYPLVSTDPKKLVACTEEEIRKNDEQLLRLAAMSRKVVLAWGAFPKHRARFAAIAELLKPYRPLCVGRTADGYPQHISRIGYDTPLEEFVA